MEQKKLVYINEILDNKLMRNGIKVKSLSTIDKLKIVYSNGFNLFDNFETKMVIKYLEENQDTNLDYLRYYFRHNLIMNSF